MLAEGMPKAYRVGSVMALNDETRCPLTVGKLGDNRTRYVHFEFCRS